MHDPCPLHPLEQYDDDDDDDDDDGVVGSGTGCEAVQELSSAHPMASRRSDADERRGDDHAIVARC
jgi:hypothetical protein